VWPALFATLAVQVLVSVAGISGAVLAPLAAPAFGVDPVYIGIYVAAIYATAACSSLASSGLIARFGPLRVSQACLVLSAVGLTAAATGEAAALIPTAVLLGLAYGPPTPASTTLLAQGTPPQWMNLVFSIRQTGVPLGNMLAGAVLPGVALAAGWQAAALLVAVACLALAVMVQPMRNGLDIARDPGRRVFARGLFVGPLKLVFRSPPLRHMTYVSFAYSGMQTALSAFLVTYLHDGLGMPLVLAGIVLSAAQIAGVGGRVLWGLVADKLATPERVLGGLGLAMTAAALATGWFTPDWPIAAIFAVCIVFGGTAVAWNGVYLAQIARLAPPGRAGEATAGSSFVTFTGVMMAPAAFSAIVSATGSYSLAFVVVAVLTCAAGLSLFVMPTKPTVKA
jgi:MFS family permease